MSDTEEGEAMSDLLAMLLVVFASMTFVVALIALIVDLIKAINKK